VVTEPVFQELPEQGFRDVSLFGGFIVFQMGF